MVFLKKNALWLLLALLAGAGYQFLPRQAEPVSAGDISRVEQAFERQESGIWVTLSASVEKLIGMARVISVLSCVWITAEPCWSHITSIWPNGCP
jgi:hypothetical protein